MCFESEQKALLCLCCGGYINLLMLLEKTGWKGCLLCQNILAVKRKNGCLKSNWLLALLIVYSMNECFN